MCGGGGSIRCPTSPVSTLLFLELIPKFDFLRLGVVAVGGDKGVVFQQFLKLQEATGMTIVAPKLNVLFGLLRRLVHDMT